MPLDESFLVNTKFRYRDPITYPVLPLDALQTSKADAVHIVRPTDQYPVNANYPVFHDQEIRPVCPNLNVPLPSPRPAVFFMVRRHVALVGYRTFLSRDGTYNNDETCPDKGRLEDLTQYLARPEQHFHEQTGFVETDESGVYRLNPAGKQIFRIEDTVISLTSDEAPNYGSFLYRLLPKVIDIAKLDTNLKILLPIEGASVRQFLLMAGINESRLIRQYVEHIYLLDRVIVPSMRNQDLWFDDESLGLFDNIRLRFGQGRGNRRILLSRKDYQRTTSAHGRAMRNEQELRDAVSARDFEIIEPQKFSAVEQVRLFSSASFIVSPSGSGLFNSVFCYPGTNLIDIESEPHWVQGHVRMFASRGLRHGVFEGRPERYEFDVPHQPFTVDVPRLVRRIDQFLA